MIIYKALYGLRSRGLICHERLADCLRDMGLYPFKAEPDNLMREKNSLHEYIVVYVGDLVIAAKDPKEVTDTLTNKHKLKIKGTVPIKYHLECDFFRDKDGTLYFSPRKYIENMIEGYITMLGKKPKHNISPPS